MKQPSGTSFLIFPLPISGPHRFPRHVNWFISTLASPSCSSLLPGSSVIIHLTYPAMVWGKSNPSRDFTWGSCPEKLMKNSSLQSNLAVCCSNRSPRGTASNKRPKLNWKSEWLYLLGMQPLPYVALTFELDFSSFPVTPPQRYVQRKLLHYFML